MEWRFQFLTEMGRLHDKRFISSDVYWRFWDVVPYESGTRPWIKLLLRSITERELILSIRVGSSPRIELLATRNVWICCIMERHTGRCPERRFPLKAKTFRRETRHNDGGSSPLMSVPSIIMYRRDGKNSVGGRVPLNLGLFDSTIFCKDDESQVEGKDPNNLLLWSCKVFKSEKLIPKQGSIWPVNKFRWRIKYWRSESAQSEDGMLLEK